MSFTISIAGGWFDIPDSAWAAGTDVTEDLLVSLLSLVRFAATCDEYFPAAIYRDGETVPTPQSADDGYAYSRSETLYAMGMNYSPDPDTGVNGGGGNVLYMFDQVEQDTGAVHSAINYYIQGGQDSNARDGTTTGIICARRGAGGKTALPGTTSSGGSGGTGGGPAGGGGNPHSGGTNPYNPLGDQGGQGDPVTLGGGKVVYTA